MHNNRFFRENPKVLQVRIGSNHSRIGGEVVEALEVKFVAPLHRDLYIYL